jgi:collagenase-like PrtC family protease
MVSESCPAAALAGNRCLGECPKDREEILRSKKGEKFLLCQRLCRSFVLHQRPFSLAAHLPELAAAGARRFRADFRFRHYEPTEVRRLWNLLRSGQGMPPVREGNWSRGI